MGVFWCTRAARREFREETGLSVNGDFIALGTIKQPGGKVMYAWALAGDCDPEAIQSNSFQMQWPPKSGTYQSFPEVDRAAWFDLQTAREKIHKGQAAFLDRLAGRLGLE